MIVIACYNIIKLVSDLLDSINKSNNIDEPILLISTDETKTEMVEYLKSIDPSQYSVEVKTDFYKGGKCYDSGAYIFAYKNYMADYYVFLQDSLTVIDPNWLNVFKSFRNSNTLNGWSCFSFAWDNHDQKNWVLKNFEKDARTPVMGIFGPIFQVSKDSLDKMDKKYNLNNFIPFNKEIGQQGMERGWACLAVNCDVKINFIEGNFQPLNEKKLFCKHSVNRR